MREDLRQNLSRLPEHACEHLATKTLYVSIEADRVEDAPFPTGSTAAYWCVLTQMPYGPDEELVEPESCLPGRACCIPRLRRVTT